MAFNVNSLVPLKRLFFNEVLTRECLTLSAMTYADCGKSEKGTHYRFNNRSLFGGQPQQTLLVILRN